MMDTLFSLVLYVCLLTLVVCMDGGFVCMQAAAVCVVAIILIMHRDYIRSLQHNCASGVVSTSHKCQICKLHAVAQPFTYGK